MPRYNLKKFINVPRIKIYTILNYISYYSFLIFCIFIPLKNVSIYLFIGIFLFIVGLFFYTWAVYLFAVSGYQELIKKGIYKLSRHPVYVSFFMITLALSTMTMSYILFILSILHFITTIFIIKAEEKECLTKYGKDYQVYCKNTRMII